MGVTMAYLAASYQYFTIVSDNSSTTIPEMGVGHASLWRLETRNILSFSHKENEDDDIVSTSREKLELCR